MASRVTGVPRPVGISVYDPERSWNGYTVYAGGEIIDMNGNLVKHFDLSQLGKVMPGGHILGDRRYNGPRMERGRELVQLDWDGNEVWHYNKTEQIEIDKKKIWSAKQHHDFEREGSPTGYYAPGLDPIIEGGNTIVLAAKEVERPHIAPGVLHGDCILEVNWDGDIVWEWQSVDHFDEMDFSEEAKNAIYRGGRVGADPYDWVHSNSVSYLGPNKWYDAGDERFHPDNFIWDGRHTNTIAVISKETGKIAWKVGPDYSLTSELRALGWIIGLHHAHMIPKGLPGEGNILVFDNGGAAGYGAPNPGAPNGRMNAVRDYSRVVEFDPITLELVWEYSALKADGDRIRACRFYSRPWSSAQRLPNGNTLICEGAGGRLFEVTPEPEIVWEFISPRETCYRAYRVPYEWIPQLDKPKEKAIAVKK